MIKLPGGARLLAMVIAVLVGAWITSISDLLPGMGRDDQSAQEWSDYYLDVAIESSVDGAVQRAYFLAASSDQPRPLVVSLHSWSGDYRQRDPLAEPLREMGWNYIHPDFRGPNRDPSACLSDLVISDIDDAIVYAIQHGEVDLNHIYVVGHSGGAYTALGYMLKGRHRLAATQAWSPITDLTAWYVQTRSRSLHYADDILRCTQSDDSLDLAEANRRSPLHWVSQSGVRQNGRVELYAGINDGHPDGGSVPVLHSVRFFNAFISPQSGPQGFVDELTMVRIENRTLDDEVQGAIAGRRIMLWRDTPSASLVLFDGGHEMLVTVSIERLQRLADWPWA